MRERVGYTISVCMAYVEISSQLFGIDKRATFRCDVAAMELKIEAQVFYFRDDGKIPNSQHPLIVYRNAFEERGEEGARFLESCLEQNNWLGSWRNGVYEFHHYHSTSHEVLGVYQGSALLHMGGESGQELRVEAGDVLIVPAGVGHKKLEGTANFAVVGAYPEGREYDLKKGAPGERPAADRNIAVVPLPALDPIAGEDGALQRYWIEGREL